MKKRAEDLNRRLPGEDTRTANPLMETHPTVRVVRETPTEMKRQQPTPVRRRTPGAAARRRRGRRVPGGVLRSGHSPARLGSHAPRRPPKALETSTQKPARACLQQLHSKPTNRESDQGVLQQAHG